MHYNVHMKDNYVGVHTYMKYDLYVYVYLYNTHVSIMYVYIFGFLRGTLLTLGSLLERLSGKLSRYGRAPDCCLETAPPPPAPPMRNGTTALFG